VSDPVVDQPDISAQPSAPSSTNSSRTDHAYDASDIQVLEGLEAVRKRPGMYIGSTGERGLHHLIWEIVDNSVDEALAGYADTIDVTLRADGSVRVKDNGRGIPVARNEQYDMSTVELVLTQLHAGGKFGGGGYKVSGGLHGVGSSVVNALSTRLDVCVRRNGHAYRMTFDHGVPTGPLEEMEETDATGTTITFWADDKIFDTVDYDWETVRARFQQMAFLNKGLTINLIDERVPATDTIDGPDLDGVDADIQDVVESADDDDNGAGQTVDTAAKAAQAKVTKAKKVSYRYDNGLVDYVTHLVSSKKSEPVHPDIISIDVEDEARSLSFELAMQWTTAYSESVHTYANTINTHEGGTPRRASARR
jgi:DNA gyrase subunit B